MYIKNYFVNGYYLFCEDMRRIFAYNCTKNKEGDVNSPSLKKGLTCLKTSSAGKNPYKS